MLQMLLTSSGWELPPSTTRLRTILDVLMMGSGKHRYL